MKKFFAVTALCIVLIIIGFGAFVAYVSRDIPEPDVSDLMVIRSVVSTNENAFYWFPTTTNDYLWPTNASFITDYTKGKDIETNLLREAIARNSNTFSAIEKGIGFRECLMPEITDWETLLPYIPVWNRIHKLMAAKVRLECEEGNYAEATDSCITLLRFGDVIRGNSESLISYLVGLASLRSGLAQARDLFRDSMMPGEQREQLMNCLFALGASEAGFTKAMKTEYRLVAGLIDGLENKTCDLAELCGTPNDSSRFWLRGKYMSGYFFQPNKTKQIFAELYRNLITNAHLAYADMTLKDPQEEFGLTEEPHMMLFRPNVVGKYIAVIMLPGCRKVILKHCEMLGAISATQLLGALTAYRVEYGVLPPDLVALVPDYLSEIPIDPFDGMPLRYNPEERVIYAVGQNLVDDNGSRKMDSRYSRRSNAKDYVFGIDEEIRFGR